MAKPQRKQARPTNRRPVLRLLPRITLRAHPIRAPVAAAPLITKPTPHRVERITQFKNVNTGRYFIAVYTTNPRTKKSERYVVDPKTLSPEKMKQLQQLHRKLKHRAATGQWLHSIIVDPSTWLAIGKILLTAA